MILVLAGCSYQVESYCYHFKVARQAVRAITTLEQLPGHDCKLVLYGTWNKHEDSQNILASAMVRGWKIYDANHRCDFRYTCRDGLIKLGC